MNKYSSICDDIHVNLHLNTEMDLPQSRESVLHFFEQVQKRFGSMTNFYARERGEFCLEEDKEGGQHRWVSVEPRRLSSGWVNPPSIENAIDQHKSILELMPYALTISHLDCESLNFAMGFHYNYRGNQNELLAEALGIVPALERMSEFPGASILGYEPSIQLALDDECRTQCRLEFETRNNAYQVRTGEFAEDQLSVYLIVRRFDSLRSDEEFASELTRLAKICVDMVDTYVVENVLIPLQQTIALK